MRSLCARVRLFQFILLGFLVLAATAAEAALSSESSAIEVYLRRQMVVNHIPAVSYAVVREGELELSGSLGLANLEWNQAATPETAFQLASATKPLTGTALMILVQEGKLRLEDSVTEYLADAPETWKAITVRHLVTHTSGLSDDLGPGDPQTAAEAVRRLVDKPLQFEPGAQSSYGIGGFAVLQHIIEHVSEQSFPQFLAERVLAPLGMEHSRFENGSNEGPFRTSDLVPQRASIYSWDGKQQRIFWFHFAPSSYTAGGLLTTAGDLGRWAAALDAGSLLDTTHRDLMFSASGGEGSSGRFAIGWEAGYYRGRPTVGHSGGPALADILRFPDDRLTIIVLANQAQMYPYLAQGVADILLPAAGSPPPPTISDDRPELTARIADFLTAVGQGEVPEVFFTPDARVGFLPQVRGFLVPCGRGLGAPTQLQLIEENNSERGASRVYRVLYDQKPVRWRFELAPDGLIAALRPTPE